MSHPRASHPWIGAAGAVLVAPVLLVTTAAGPVRATPAAPCFDVGQHLGSAGHAGSGQATTGVVGDPMVLWTAPTAGPMVGAPAIVDGVAYVADGLFAAGGLRAIDTATGTELWNVALPGLPFGSSPAVADGVAYVGDLDGNVSAVDLAVREVTWTVRVADTVSSSPAVADGLVVVNADDVVTALDPATGEARWTFANGGDGGYTLESSPAVVDGTVFATSVGSDGDPSMWALDAATGEQRWSYSPPAPGLGTPVYDDGVVYAGGTGGLVAVDAVTGEERWTSAVGDVFSAPAVDAALLVVHTSRQLVAVDPATGDERWRADTGGSWSTPTVVDDVVYVGSNGMAFQQSVQLLDAATGEQLARIEGFGSVNAPVVVTGGAAYAATGDGLVAIGSPGTSTCAAPPAP